MGILAFVLYVLGAVLMLTVIELTSPDKSKLTRLIVVSIWPLISVVGLFLGLFLGARKRFFK